MKNILINFINKLLSSRGLTIVKKYELIHRDFKYSEAINELTQIFNDEVAILPKGNDKRKLFLKKLYGTQLSEALYIIYYLNKSMKITGDICEFGCANGATSVLIANEIKDTKKTLWLFDSFKGLSRPSKKDKLINDMFGLKSMRKYEGTMSYSSQEVVSRVNEAGISNKRIKIIDGFIEDTINIGDLPQKIAFSFIDFDLYEPIKIALEYIHRHLSKNGYIIVDDYDFFSSGVKEAVTEFLHEHKREYEFILPKRFAGNFCILSKL